MLYWLQVTQYGAGMTKKTKKKGNTPDGDIRLGVNIDRKLHKRLKLAAVQRETTIGDLLGGLNQETPLEHPLKGA